MLSVLCEPVSTWQSSIHELTASGSKHLPFRQGGGAAFLECGAIDEVALLGEVVVERGGTDANFCSDLICRKRNIARSRRRNGRWLFSARLLA